MSQKRKPLSQLDYETNKRSRSTGSTRLSNCHDTQHALRAGTIQKIILNDFMCHGHLEVNFGTNGVTIVTGENGSGKSAILTALILGLGGKSTITSRGNSIKNFIRTGTTSACIHIDICNTGLMAYRPAEYGNRISVIRKFSPTSSTYKIRSENGQVVSSTLKELQRIITALNIQVDNPICILNQDISRNFLSSGNPAQRYVLFLKGTRLDKLAEEYKKIKDNLTYSQQKLSEKQKIFVKMISEVNTLTEKINTHKSISSLKETKKSLRIEFLWAKVLESENELKILKEDISKCSKKHEECLELSEGRIERAATIRKAVGELDTKIEDVRNSREIAKKSLSEQALSMNQLLQTVTNNENKKKHLKTLIDLKNSDMEYLKNEIKNITDSTHLIEQQKTENERRKNDLTEKLKNKDNHLHMARNELFQIKENLNQENQKKRTLLDQLNDTQKEIDNCKWKQQQLMTSKSNLSIYGPHMTEIKQKISEWKHRFTHQPLGPLGSYVKLKDKKWAMAVEGYLTKSFLCSFLVDNKNDNNLLRQIFNMVQRNESQINIISTKFLYKPHNIAKYKVSFPRDCTSVYDVIDISDVNVSNCFVDQMSIESILLVPDDERAIQLLSQKQYVPTNCKLGITINGDRYYPDPNFRTYANRHKLLQLLQDDKSAIMEQLKNSIISLNTKAEDLQRELLKLKEQQTRLAISEDEISKKINDIVASRSQIKQVLDDLHNAVQHEVRDAKSLEEELQSIRQAIMEKQAANNHLEDEISKSTELLNNNKEKITSLKRTLDNYEKQLSALNEERSKKAYKEIEMSLAETSQKNKLAELQEQIDQKKLSSNKKKEELNQNTAEAESVGKRPVTIRSISEVKLAIAKNSNDIALIEADSENIENIMEKYYHLQSRCTDTKNVLEIAESNVTELKNAVVLRNNAYKLTKIYLKSVMKYNFQYVLKLRQFKGDLHFDDENKQLNLAVIPQECSQSLTKITNLSGGERSFTTVAFLYSLWQCTQFPFYFLDEFDVYMDKLNRTKVFEILMNHANTHPEFQFVFFTPQDISFLQKGVNCLRLESPHS